MTKLFKYFDQVLSVNYDYVDDQFLQILCNCMSLKRIVIHIHSNIKIHPGTSEEAWRQLTKYWYNKISTSSYYLVW